MTLICYQYGTHTSLCFINTPLYLVFCYRPVKSTSTSKNGTYSLSSLSQLNSCHAPICHSRSSQPTFIDVCHLLGTDLNTENIEMAKVTQGSLVNGMIDM